MVRDEQAPRDGGTSAPASVAIRRTVPQDVVDVGAPLMGIVVGTLIGRLLVGQPITAVAVVATLAGAATVVVPIRLLTRVHSLELHPGGLRIVRHLWFRDLLWWQITATLVEERRFIGRRLLVWGPAGRITMPFPHDHRWPDPDHEFDEKVAMIRAWWVAGLRPTSTEASPRPPLGPEPVAYPLAPPRR